MARFKSSAFSSPSPMYVNNLFPFALSEQSLLSTASLTVKVTRSVDTSDNELSPQEEKTIRSIADAR